MKTRMLRDIEVSEVGMGCMAFSHGYGKIPPERYSIEAIRGAYEHGCTFFDTAEVYSPNLAGIGHNELIVGKALAPVRDEVVIATKIMPRGGLGGNAHRTMREHLEGSLKRLQTDRVDLYYIHRSGGVDIEDAAEAMGAATVCELYRQGAKLVVLDINEEAWEELVEDEELADGPGTLHFVAGDVNDPAVRQEAIDYAKSEFGALDGLLYIAGVLDLMSPAHKTDDELWDYVMDVNVNSCFRMCRDCLPLLWDHEGLPSNIVIVGSVGGVIGSSAGAAYIASKHAVLGLARNLAHTYRFRNVDVNVVNPGACVTDILGNAMEKWPDRDVMDDEGNELYNVRGAVSLGVDYDGNNITGWPEDIANAILYLISDEASYVNGAVLTVDGGWTSF